MRIQLSGQVPVAGSCRQSNELSGSIKAEEFGEGLSASEFWLCSMLSVIQLGMQWKVLEHDFIETYWLDTRRNRVPEGSCPWLYFKLAWFSISKRILHTYM